MRTYVDVLFIQSFSRLSHRFSAKIFQYLLHASTITTERHPLAPCSSLSRSPPCQYVLCLFEKPHQTEHKDISAVHKLLDSSLFLFKVPQVISKDITIQ